MKLLQIEFSKENLQALPENDRIFFITLSHITNEINALSKFAFWSSLDSSTQVEEHGQFTNILLFVRLLAGKLNEAWEVYQRSFFGTGLSKTYEPMLDKRCSAAMQALKQYFGRQNAAHLLRNVVAFHYSPKELDASLANFSDPLFAYLDKTAAPNNLFFYAEQLVSHTVISTLGLEGKENPFPSLVGELFGVSADFVTAADGIMDAILKRNGEEIRSKEPAEIELEGLKDFKNVSLPWFSDTTYLKK